MWRNHLPLLVLFMTIGHGAGAAETFVVPTEASALMTRYCGACHGAKKQKGDVRLDTLASLSVDARFDLLNAMQESIRFQEMALPESQWVLSL